MHKHKKVVVRVRLSDSCEISPRSACCALASGSMRNESASDDEKTMAVIASVGKCVFCSKPQIIMLPKRRKASAHSDMSIPYKKPKAIPGKVRWPRAPLISAIRLVTISEPRYPAMHPIQLVIINEYIKTLFIIVMLVNIKFYI